MSVQYQHLIIFGCCSFMYIISSCALHPILVWCSFMQIIDYDIISSCVINPILGWCSFMHIIDCDIISSCVLNSILCWGSFIYIIIIYMSEWVYMYIYQNSRATVALTGVCIVQITKAVVYLLWNWCIHACLYYQNDRSSSALVVKLNTDCT